MGKSPAFRLYASDFYMDTQTWSNEEVGVYLRLLLYQWINGSIPNDENLLAFELKGRPLVEMGDDSPLYEIVSEIMENILTV